MKSIVVSAFLVFGSTALLADTRDVKIQGMHCEECAKSIEREVKKIPGVTDVQVNLEAKSAKVTTKDGVKIEDKALKKAIEKAGYKFLG